MAAPRYDVIGIGNAIVDVLARTDDDFLVRQKMPKGSMSLIDETRAETIYSAMGPAAEISGGSAANTMVGVASFGGRAAFVGKVKEDGLGKVFAHDIRAAGVAFTTKAAKDGPSTARCYILVTPDGERTMNTYLGAAQHLSPADVATDEIAAAAITYLEGYLWDPKDAKEAFRKAAKIAHDAGRAVALTLSDSFCVDRYRGEFQVLLRERVVDLVFANESELKSLYETADFDTALAALKKDAKLGVVTRSEKGAVVVDGGKTEIGAGLSGRARGRRHRRRRPVRRGFSPRLRARFAAQGVGATRRAGGGRSDLAHGRAAVAETFRARARERPANLMMSSRGAAPDLIRGREPGIHNLGFA